MSRSSRRAPLFDNRSAYLDRFGLLLAATGASIVLLSLVDLRSDGGLGSQLLSLGASSGVALTLTGALRASGLAARPQRLVDALLLLGLLGLGGVLLLDVFAGASLPLLQQGAPPLGVVLLAVLAPAIVVRRLAHHTGVRVSTLLGAVSAYLLIPVAYCYLLLTVDVNQATPVFGQPEPTTSFMYFSLTTLTTVGYGDLAPATPLARLLATSEALVGQVYLVTFVAMLVGLAGERLRGRSAAAGPETG